jgi:5S rRNA maturation endonuclease (ribonuclease M5)
MQKHYNSKTLDVEAVKSAIHGREVEILRHVGGLPNEILDGKKEHPCPKCGGNTRFRLIDAKDGAVRCSHCFKDKSDGNNGDLISSIMWICSATFPEALQLIGDYCGVNAVSHSTAKRNVKSGKPTFDQNNIVAEYHYTDAKGQTAYRVLRDCRKNFMQCRPHSDKPGQWVWNLNGVDRVPYGLPKLLDENCKVVYIVEGEKDADNLNRLLRDCEIIDRVATTSAGGVPSAKQWAGFVNEYGLAEKQVMVIPDNDEAGIPFGREVCKAFVNAGCQSVKMIILPEVKDISDLIDLRTRYNLSGYNGLCVFLWNDKKRVKIRCLQRMSNCISLFYFSHIAQSHATMTIIHTSSTLKHLIR